MMMTCWRWYQFTRFDKIRSAFQQFNSSFSNKVKSGSTVNESRKKKRRVKKEENEGFSPLSCLKIKSLLQKWKYNKRDNIKVLLNIKLQSRGFINTNIIYI